MYKRCCLEPLSKYLELEIEAVINCNEKYRLVLHRCIIERAKGAFIQKYKPWCYFSPLLILSVMDARVPLCKRTMGNKKLRAEIKLWNHMILKEYLPNTKQKKNLLFPIFLTREKTFSLNM